VLDHGGAVFTNASIVPVTFDGDGLRPDIEAFVSRVGASDYWRETTAEYGVEPISAVTPIHLSEAPPGAIQDSDVEAWLSSKLDGTDAAWGLPDPRKLYAIFYPATTRITLDSLASCTDYLGGYHNAMTVGGVTIAYAAILRCDHGFGGVTGALDSMTVGLTHELLEASTDPFLDAYTEPDDKSIYPFAFSGEVADMCEFEGDAADRTTDSPYPVHRAWSNAAARAGREPCAPASPGSVYFNSAPVMSDSVSFDYFGTRIDANGVRIPVGARRTVPVALWSDAPTSGPWTVSAEDVEAFRGGAPVLRFTLDRASGQNGDTLQMTIEVLSADPRYGAEPFVVTSSLGGAIHRWFGIVGQ
jgi:hypothetical protein